MRNNNTEYKAPEKQYLGTDLGPGSIVNAEYVEASGENRGNPFIEAIPPMLAKEDAMKWYERPIMAVSENELQKMSDEQKVTDVLRLDDVRFLLPQDLQLNRLVYTTLISSYRKRRLIVGNENDYVDLHLKSDMVKQENRMIPKFVSDPVRGILVGGIGGSGKSESLNRTLARLPQVIIHELSPGKKTVQVLYLVVSLQVHSNFRSLWVAFGAALDNALGNVRPIYAAAMSRRKSVGAQKDYARELIEIFHIGEIFVDEIQLISKISASKDNGIEMFMTLSNETGCVISALGTREGVNLLMSRQQVARRFGEPVISENYMHNRVYFRGIMDDMWKYQWVPREAEYTDEIDEYIYSKTKGIIGFIKMFWAFTQILAVCKGMKQINIGLLKTAGEKYMDPYTRSAELDDFNIQETPFAVVINKVINDVAGDSLPLRRKSADIAMLEAYVVQTIKITNGYNERLVREAFKTAMDKDSLHMRTQTEALAKTMQQIAQLTAENKSPELNSEKTAIQKKRTARREIAKDEQEEKGKNEELSRLRSELFGSESSEAI